MTGHANYVRLYKLIRDSLLTNDFHRIHTHGDSLNRSDNKWHLVTFYSSLSSSLVLLERFNFYLEGIDFITQKDVTVFINTQFIGKQCQFVSWGCLEVLEFRSLLYILIKYTNSIAHRPHNFAFLFRVIDYMIIQRICDPSLFIYIRILLKVTKFFSVSQASESKECESEIKKELLADSENQEWLSLVSTEVSETFPTLSII